MPDICLGFEVHQPIRIDGSFREELAKGKKLGGLLEVYFDNGLNRDILRRVAQKCYVPANGIILQKIDELKAVGKEFSVVYSLSGVLVEQLERWAPDALETFRQLADTGRVELLDQTYYHSLSSLYSSERGEFVDQVLLHRQLMRDVFGLQPRVFENTEFIYNNSIAGTLKELGFSGVFTEGRPRILGWRSPNYIYRAEGSDLAVLLRNHVLSDDIAFRFSAPDWLEWPLTADKYASWLSATAGQCVVVFIDYETFGEHQWPETGILEFLGWLPSEVAKHDNLSFKTASELIASHPPVGEVNIGPLDTISWADVDGTTDAWLGNDMQRTSYHAIRRMEPFVKRSGDQQMLKLWRLLQTSDHLYYMYTQWGASGLVHGYFSSQPPVKAFWAFMRIASNLQKRTAQHLKEPYRTSTRLLRVVSPDEAFHFHEHGRYIDLSAHSLDEFNDALALASDRSILFHNSSKDFGKWVGDTIGDVKLARQIGKVTGAGASELRRDLRACVEGRLEELRSVLT